MKAKVKSNKYLRKGYGQFRRELLRLENSTSFKEDWDKCSKCNIHKNFIDVKDIESHLSDPDLIEMVQVRARLTGKLVIKDEYGVQCSTCFVEDADEYPSHGLTDNTSEQSERDMFRISLSSAQHAVCMENEITVSANCCSVELDYDISTSSNQQPEHHSYVLKCENIYIKEEDIDFCVVVCVTDNSTLIADLRNAIELHYKLGSSLMDKYDQMKETGRYVIIISYPHGYSKLVSIGKVIDTDLNLNIKRDQKIRNYIYNTTTCPGSSGASVYVQGKWRHGFGHCYFYPPVHCGAYENNIGQSSVGVESVS